jgi:2,3-bisphosphoglycerate-dependent phosphoglycerate mutase
MELYFIRHGQSQNNANWGRADYRESSDPELTEIGKKQAAEISKYLADNQCRDEDYFDDNQNVQGFGLTHIYTSLMVRAVGTATPIAHRIGIPLVAWPDIHETGGIFSREIFDNKSGLPGKNRIFFEEFFPGLILPEWLDQRGWWNQPFEERDARLPRAEKVWRELINRHGDQPGMPEHRVALVSHGGFYNYLLTSALEVQMERITENRHKFWFILNNCGMTRIDLKNGQVRIPYANRISFLPYDLIT